MSLLMEALRKAEEAKSKAAKEQNDNPPEQEKSLEDTLEYDLAPDASDDSGPASPGNPVVINPDPDEEEILSQHKTAPGAGAPADDYNAIDFNAAPVPDQFDNARAAVQPDDDDLAFIRSGDAEDPESPADIPELTDIIGDTADDALSLQQSSYFSRITPNPDRKPFDEDDLDFDAPVDPDPLTDTDTAGRDEDTGDAQVVAQVSQAASTTKLTPQSAKEKEQAIRDSAGSLFLAKQDSQKRRMRKLAAIAAGVLVFPLAGGIYWFYTEMTSTPQMGFNVASTNTAGRFLGEGMPAEAADTGNADTATPDPFALAENTDTGQAETTAPEPLVVFPVEETPAQVVQAEPVPVPVAQAVTPPPPASTPAQNTVAIAQQPAPVAPAPQNSPVQNTQPQNSQSQNNGLAFTRTTAQPQINPDLSAAYDSYRQGDLAMAGRLYQQVLGREPVNRDALLGLASVYLKQNNISLAQNLYVRLLELNPRDPLARAGLLDAMQDDPVRQEAELKALINAYPGNAPLAFALGNLYATQSRWNDAQNAYFDALLAAKSANAGPVSPDYAFNLAVSLERINQLQPALEYYREAAAYARNAAPGFDPALLQQRLNYLEQQLP